MIYLNGEFMPIEQARVPVLDRGFIFGDGVYEVIPVYSRHPFRLAEHLRRLQDSLDAISLLNPHDNSTWKPSGHNANDRSSSDYRSRDEYRIGANVEVNWKGRWYSARIMEVKEGRHLVHYAGYDDSWDEWVPDNRIRRPSWNN